MMVLKLTPEDVQFLLDYSRPDADARYALEHALIQNHQHGRVNVRLKHKHCEQLVGGLMWAAKENQFEGGRSLDTADALCKVLEKGLAHKSRVYILEN